MAEYFKDASTAGASRIILKGTALKAKGKPSKIPRLSLKRRVLFVGGPGLLMQVYRGKYRGSLVLSSRFVAGHLAVHCAVSACLAWSHRNKAGEFGIGLLQFLILSFIEEPKLIGREY